MSKVVDGARLSSIIAPAFYQVHWDIMDGLHTYYDLYGGRGSTKSSFIGNTPVTNGAAVTWSAGENVLTFTVKAENAAVTTYTVTVNKS